MRIRFLSVACLLLPVLVAAGCGDDTEPPKPVVVRGTVLSTGGSPIAGARVTAVDVNDAPVSGTVITNAEGAYELDVSAARNQAVKLRASAQGFESFPSGIQRSLPLQLSAVVESGAVLVYTGSLSEIRLEPLGNPGGFGSIAGNASGLGALVVAEGPVVRSTITGADGEYVIFNLPAGTYDVRAYVADSQFDPAQAAVIEGQTTAGVDLVRTGSATGSVSGSVNIVNAPGGSATSVVLVVASTFNEALERGDVPPGLRAPRTGIPTVTGSFTIAGVPAGTYKVLAAFENDDLVRDPDPNISGTQIVEVTVDGGAVSLPTSFKITEALAVVSPGAGDAPTEVIGDPTLTWADDSSEDYYSVEVFNSRGEIVWADPDVPGVSGSPTVSVVYDGPALEPGRVYQFRATSWRINGGSGVPGPISTTEDLRGMMVVP